MIRGKFLSFYACAIEYYLSQPFLNLRKLSEIMNIREMFDKINVYPMLITDITKA